MKKYFCSGLVVLMIRCIAFGVEPISEEGFGFRDAKFVMFFPHGGCLLQTSDGLVVQVFRGSQNPVPAEEAEDLARVRGGWDKLGDFYRLSYLRAPASTPKEDRIARGVELLLLLAREEYSETLPFIALLFSRKSTFSFKDEKRFSANGPVSVISDKGTRQDGRFLRDGFLEEPGGKTWVGSGYQPILCPIGSMIVASVSKALLLIANAHGELPISSEGETKMKVSTLLELTTPELEVLRSHLLLMLESGRIGCSSDEIVSVEGPDFFKNLIKYHLSNSIWIFKEPGRLDSSICCPTIQIILGNVNKEKLEKLLKNEGRLVFGDHYRLHS